MPVTIPVVEIVPTIRLVLLHTPPPTVLVNVVVDPWHTVSVPLIADGTGLTVTVVVT